MTTNVVVKNPQYAEWDVDVFALDHKFPRADGDKPSAIVQVGTIQPGGEQTFYATDTRDILVKERKHK